MWVGVCVCVCVCVCLHQYLKTVRGSRFGCKAPRMFSHVLVSFVSVFVSVCAQERS